MARTNDERIAKLKDIRDKYDDRLEEMASSPKVSYDVDGQKFDFTQYQEFLMKHITDLNDLIASLESKTLGGLGFVETQIFTGS